MISLKFVPMVQINNIPALVSTKPIYWTNDGLFTDTYMRHAVSMN